jgi:cbb3-type cytochrome oxidase maturation protein
MDVIYSLIPGMMFFGLLFLVVLIWALRSGQFQDLRRRTPRASRTQNNERSPVGACENLVCR